MCKMCIRDRCRPALGKKPFFARRKPPDKMCRSHGPRFSMIQKDGMMRVYIACLLYTSLLVDTECPSIAKDVELTVEILVS